MHARPNTTFSEIEGCIYGCDLVFRPQEELLDLRRLHLTTHDGNRESRVMVDSIDFLMQRPRRSLATMDKDHDDHTGLEP